VEFVKNVLPAVEPNILKSSANTVLVGAANPCSANYCNRSKAVLVAEPSGFSGKLTPTQAHRDGYRKGHGQHGYGHGQGH
jgi:hypothetical protein